MNYLTAARYSGGVVVVSDDGVAVVDSCQIINNTAQFSGAVFSIFSSEIYVRNSTFASNVAGVDGSICASAIGYAYFEGNSIIENKAYRGGCFFLDLSAKLLTIGNMIVNNQVFFSIFIIHVICRFTLNATGYFGCSGFSINRYAVEGNK